MLSSRRVVGCVFRSGGTLVLGNLALRHQIAVLQRRGTRRPRLSPLDRGLWVLLSMIWVAGAAPSSSSSQRRWSDGTVRAPEHRAIEPPDVGDKIVALPMVGGLQHRHTRRAA